MTKKIKLLITGGTGSFGKAVLNRYIKNNKISEIRIISRDEEKQDSLRQQLNNDKVKFYIGDVRDRKSVNDAVRGSDMIFHAAALKQVPSCEFFPIQAVETNVIGTSNVLDAAIEYGVKKVVVLSTDKAVYPINAMGMSKGLMEKLMVAKSRIGGKKTIICATRYGNVMASRGSVIPLIINQIKSGKNITITDKNMTRFLLTLNNAIDLVEYAYLKAKPGDIFVQKAPSAKIYDLAIILKKIYKSNTPIKYIGIRHGEKLFETLVNKEERAKCIENRNYFKIPADNRGLDYNSYLSSGKSKIKFFEEYNSENTNKFKGKELLNLLMNLDIIKNDIEK